MTIIMLSCTIGLILAGGAFIGWEQRVFRTSMTQNLSTQAKMIADNCKASLAFQDTQDAEKILQALHVDSSITIGCVYTSNEELFAAYYRDYPEVKLQLTNLRRQGFDFKAGSLTVSSPIILDKEIIGAVFLRSDLTPMYTMLKRSSQIIIAVLFISLLAAFLVSSKLQTVISRPILNLAQLAKTVSERKDYTTRALKQSNDEVGLLIDAFNEMLGQIQKRDSELFDAKEGLARKVDERTAELSKTNEQMTVEIAERKQAELKQQSLNAELEEANNELKNFVYIASHDMREPLRKITSFGTMLEKSLSGKLVDDDAENLRFMVDGATRMTKMIEGLLVYSRVSTKANPAEIVDLNEIVQQLQQLELSIVLEEKQATIEVPKPLPNVEVDPVQIRQLMQNFIANGIKYQAKGNLPRITITSKPAADGMIRVEVTDNGIGIAPENQGSVFAMFKRLHSRNEYEGTGIGLAVCKKIVERHGGKVGIESEPGKGATFWFTVPAVSSKPTAVDKEVESSV
ncbi:MAG: ATP-binding protein [Phycisphaerae bacterium]|nr:ATP-binding protein [Phycisphaerae bacterium]